VGLQERLDPLPKLEMAIVIAVENCAADRGVMMAWSLKKNSLHALRVQRRGVLLQRCTISPIHTLTRRLWPVLSKTN
jgi:hypothetical protein